MDQQAAAVLSFWFGAEDDPARHQPREAWFRKDESFDAAIRQRFGALIERALAGELGAWSSERGSALAQIIVLDQFTRNTYRGSARAFAGDALALSAARALVARGDDRLLPGVQRQFVYLPFEHAEDLVLQEQSLRLFGALAAEQARPDLLTYAERHHAIIARFGRFPHRNAVLGRSSSAEEMLFLQQPGSSF